MGATYKVPCTVSKSAVVLNLQRRIAMTLAGLHDRLRIVSVPECLHTIPLRHGGRTINESDTVVLSFT